MTQPPSSPPTLGLRHAVLWVSDPRLSAQFYQQALGLTVTHESDSAVFMSSTASATDHDLGLFKAATHERSAPQRIGLYHLAWEVASLADLKSAKQRLTAMGALVGENNHGTSRSLYANDPDGIEFEVMWEVPLDQVDPDAITNVPLDFDSDFAQFGPSAPSRGANKIIG